jgi:hypothetical protein
LKIVSFRGLGLGSFVLWVVPFRVGCEAVASCILLVY